MVNEISIAIFSVCVEFCECKEFLYLKSVLPKLSVASQIIKHIQDDQSAYYCSISSFVALKRYIF